VDICKIYFLELNFPLTRNALSINTLDISISGICLKYTWRPGEIPDDPIKYTTPGEDILNHAHWLDYKKTVERNIEIERMQFSNIK